MSVIFLTLVLLLSHSEDGRAAQSNTVPNGSFEVGAWGWSPVDWVEASIATDGCYDGNYCLNLKSPYITPDGLRRKRVQSQYIALEATDGLSFTFYAKGGAEKTPLVVSLKRYYENDCVSEDIHLATLLINKQWRNYELKIPPEYLSSVHRYLIQFDLVASSSQVWLDRISISNQRGHLTDRATVDLAVYTKNKNGISNVGDSVEIVTLYSPDESHVGGHVLDYKVYDLYGEVISEWDEPVDLVENKNGTHRSLWDPKDTGAYRVIVELINAEQESLARGEAVFSVLPFVDFESMGSPFGIVASIDYENVDTARRLGFSWLRVHDSEDFTNWFRVEPEKGEFSWFDEKVDIAKANRMNILGVIEKAPYWVYGGKYTKEDSAFDYRGIPPDLNLFEEYVIQLVRHYRGDVSYWEVWNEPYQVSFWKGSTNEFVKLLEVAYKAIKEADPNALVVGPAGRLKFIEDIYELGAIRYLDILSYHQYFQDTDPWNSISSEREMVEKLKALGVKYGKDVPIWNTEGGIVSGSFYTIFEHRSFSCKENGEEYPLLTVQDASALTVRWWASNLANGVEKNFYYYLRRDGVGMFELRGRYQSLLEYDGKPKPQGVAIAVLASLLGNKYIYLDRVTLNSDYGSVECTLFDTEMDPLAICWLIKDDKNVGEVDLILGESTVKAKNIMGKDVKIFEKTSGKAVRVSLDPTYLVGPLNTEKFRIEHDFLD